MTVYCKLFNCDKKCFAEIVKQAPLIIGNKIHKKRMSKVYDTKRKKRKSKIIVNVYTITADTIDTSEGVLLLVVVDNEIVAVFLFQHQRHLVKFAAVRI